MGPRYGGGMTRRRRTPTSTSAARAARARRERAREELRHSRRHVTYAVGYTVVAVAIVVAYNWLLGLKALKRYVASVHSEQYTGAGHALMIGAAVAFLVFGVLATRRFAAAFGHLVAARSPASVVPAVRLTVSIAGYVIIFIGVLGLLDVPLEHLLIGAGLAGIVLGIAGQQTLGNVFAGIVLIVARPFTVGDHVRIRAGALGGIFEGDVLGMSLTYVTLSVEGIALKIPNSAMLAAGVGRMSGRRTTVTGQVPVVAGAPSGPVPVVAGAPNGSVSVERAPSGLVPIIPSDCLATPGRHEPGTPSGEVPVQGPTDAADGSGGAGNGRAYDPALVTPASRTARRRAEVRAARRS